VSKLIGANGRHPKVADTIASTDAFVVQNEKALIFCDHHLPVADLGLTPAVELRWPRKGERSRKKGRAIGLDVDVL
jgi:hypothetical protein